MNDFGEFLPSFRTLMELILYSKLILDSSIIMVNMEPG